VRPHVHKRPSSHQHSPRSLVPADIVLTRLYPKTLDRRPCTGRSQETVVIFIFGLEALFTRDSRVLFCAVSSSPKLKAAIGYYNDKTQFSISSHSDQTSFRSSSLYLWALGKHCFVKMSSSTLCCTVFLFNVFGFINSMCLNVFAAVFCDFTA
jgi:hypothetical protein